MISFNVTKLNFTFLSFSKCYTLKKIGFLRNPQKRFRRLEKASECVHMLKKRIFNSTEPLKVLPADTREEPFVEKPFFSLRNLKKGFVQKYGTFRVPYGTINGFAINPTKLWFCTKPLRVPYGTLKVPYFCTKPFFKVP